VDEDEDSDSDMSDYARRQQASRGRRANPSPALVFDNLLNMS
jgi:hypothetical protein